MTILTVTAKGQLTLKKDVPKHLGVRPGERVDVDMLPDGRVEVRAAPPKGRISDVFGFLKQPGAPSLSIEAISDLAAGGWAKER